MGGPGLKGGQNPLSTYMTVVAEIHFSEARKMGRGVWGMNKFWFKK